MKRISPFLSLLIMARCLSAMSTTKSTTTTRRRDVLTSFVSAGISLFISPKIILAESSYDQNNMQNFVYSNEWTGTGLELLSFQQAASLAVSTNSYFSMGKWPDPILRRPASKVKFASESSSLLDDLKAIADTLRRTARLNGAVGLAAQQCAIDTSMIFLDDPKLLKKKKEFSNETINQGGQFLVNPRILARSPEVDMLVWEEECLVLPPTFRATVLRDAQILVQYETLAGLTQTVELQGELARCLEHELDHDRGILITDHVGLDELESDTMRNIERQGHDQRQELAYSRFISSDDDDNKNFLATLREQMVPNANAQEPLVPPPSSSGGGDNGTLNQRKPPDSSTSNADSNNCDEDCLQKRKQIIQERRAMMMQSRSNTKRSDVFELSKQRAAMYGTTYQGATCPPGAPCI